MKLKKDIAFCGRRLDAEELALVLELAGDFLGIARSELANTICELLDWKRPNGKLKTIECIQFLEGLESRGLLKLAPKRHGRIGGDKPIARTDIGEAKQPITGTPRLFGGAVLERVDSREQQKIFKELVDRYHYLGYKTPYGARLRYLIRCGKEHRLLGCLQFSSPAWKVKSRDDWIGWSAAQRKSRLQLIVQNSRLLILPWVTVKNLASHVLGLASRQLPGDWQELYGYRPVLLETFVEQRFQGTSYRAANWLALGETQGRGRMDRHHRHEKTVKTVWIYPLHRQAKRLLTAACQ